MARRTTRRPVMVFAARGWLPLRWLVRGWLMLVLVGCNAILGTDGFGPEATGDAAGGGDGDDDGDGGAGGGAGGEAPTNRHLWSRAIGSVERDVGMGVAVGRSGDVVVAGVLGGPLSFGGTALTAAGAGDALVARLDLDGTPLWARSFGDTAEQVLADVAVDASGAIVVIGSNAGTLDFGKGPLTAAGSTDIVVAKLSASGEAVWSRAFGDAATQRGLAIAVNQTGDVFLTGSFRGTVAFGDVVLVGDGARDDVFVSKLDGETGSPAWALRLRGEVGDHAGLGVAVDATGGPLVVGSFVGTLAVGSTTLAASGAERDGFLVALTAEGELRHARSFGGAGIDEVRAVAVLDDGLVIGGRVTGPVDFGGGPTSVEAGGGALFVARLDDAGEHVWSTAFGAADGNRVERITVDGAGDIVVAGGFAGQLLLGDGTTHDSAGDSDVFVAKLGADGSLRWSADFGRNDDDRAHGVATDEDDNIVLVGRFQGAFALEAADPLAGTGGDDIFLVKLAP